MMSLILLSESASLWNTMRASLFFTSLFSNASMLVQHHNIKYWLLKYHSDAHNYSAHRLREIYTEKKQSARIMQSQNGYRFLTSD